MKQTFLCVIALIALFALSACRRDAPQPAQEKPADTAQGRCPKLEGSFFGADKSTIKAGEGVELQWKLPREYVNASVRVEKIEEGDSSNLPIDFATSHDAAMLPPFLSANIPNVKPTRTTKYVLKAAGPEGCAPLELPATVKVE